MSMELAEALQRELLTPFRVGHHFASEVDVRGGGQERSVQRHEAAPGRGGLPPHAFAVGPQPAKTTRMLGESCKALTADRAWVGDRRDRLAAGQAQLNNAFAELLRR